MPERQPRLNVRHDASLALKPRSALLLSAQLTFASCCESCETWCAAIGRQVLAKSSVYVSQHCLMPAGRLPTIAPYSRPMYALDSRSPLPSSPVQDVWRLLESHATSTVLASRLTAIHAETMVPHSLHIPEQLIYHVHAVFGAIDKPPLDLPGSEEPNCFHSTCLPWPVAA